MSVLYNRIEQEDGTYLVTGMKGEVIRNHFGTPYPPLSENVSRNLIDELNHINETSFTVSEEQIEKRDIVLAQVIDTITGNEMRNSLSYCLLSTMIECDTQQEKFTLRYIPLLQEDKFLTNDEVFLKDSPPYASTLKAREFLYYQDEKPASESFHARGSCIQYSVLAKIEETVNKMQMVDQFAVDLIYQYLDRFSITLPILWVGGIVDDEKLIEAYYAIEHQLDISDLNEEEVAIPRFMMNRLLCLKIILFYGYRWGDPTLPCIGW